MEEILASIRRIISDDQEVLRGASRERGEPSSLTNLLDLTERQAAQLIGHSGDEAEGDPEGDTQGSDAHEQSVSGLRFHDEGDDDAQHAPVPPRSPAGNVFSDPRRTDTLLSSTADASVSEAFTRLGSTIMPTEPQTLEGLMRDLLRPMLKSWLDENLPTLVERLVQAEIERISRGRR